MAPKRAMPEPTWKLEAAPVDSGASVLVPVPWKPASLELVALALLRELVVVAVRVAMLMVVLRDMEAPVPEAIGAVPAGVTGTIAEVVPLLHC
jgi:hypothetical protein